MDYIKRMAENALVELVNPSAGSTLPPWAVALALVALLAVAGNLSIGDFIY